MPSARTPPITAIGEWAAAEASKTAPLGPRRDLRRGRTQVRIGNAPRVMATLRNTAISLLRHAGWTTSPPPADITPVTPERSQTVADQLKRDSAVDAGVTTVAWSGSIEIRANEQ